jgi:hypothetical protein
MQVQKNGGMIGRAACCFFSLALVGGFCLPAASALADDSGSVVAATGPDMTSKVVDATLVRPLGVLSTLAGAGFFVVSLPITIAVEQVGTAREVLLDTPYENTFERPLGRL